jgi:hypothetical protein
MCFLLRNKKIAVVVLSLLVSGSTIAKDWRGITPLHSTRTDVERLLGTAWHNFISGSVYKVDQGTVQIVYTGQGDPAELCGRKVPLNTVLSIFVDPKEKVPLTDLDFSLNHFASFKLWLGEQDYRAYYDGLSGFVLHSVDARVHDLSYLANAADRPRCANYYRNAKHFGEMRYDDF